MKFDWLRNQANQIPCMFHFSPFDVIMKKVTTDLFHNDVKHGKMKRTVCCLQETACKTLLLAQSVYTWAEMFCE